MRCGRLPVSVVSVYTVIENSGVLGPHAIRRPQPEAPLTKTTYPALSM